MMDAKQIAREAIKDGDDFTPAEFEHAMHAYRMGLIRIASGMQNLSLLRWTMGRRHDQYPHYKHVGGREGVQLSERWGFWVDDATLEDFDDLLLAWWEENCCVLEEREMK